jgi:hypothetical protein
MNASTAYVCQWIRVGNVVTVSGKFGVDPASNSIATELGMSLPIASNFAAEENAGGIALSEDNIGDYRITADTTNDRVKIISFPTSNASHNLSFTFTYLIL